MVRFVACLEIEGDSTTHSFAQNESAIEQRKSASWIQPPNYVNMIL